MAILPKLIFKLNTNPFRVLAGFSVEINKPIPKFMRHCKRLRTTKSILKKDKVGRTHTSSFKITPKRWYSRQCGTLPQGQAHGPTEEGRVQK